MSQQKVASNYYLILQSSYDLIEVGLGVDQLLLDQQLLNKIDASRDLISTIDGLLHKHNLTLTNLSFITANLGPAPFTSLRVVIVTVNGLAYATGIPLIGVNGLQAFVTEFSTPPNTRVESDSAGRANSYQVTVALLNAYNQDLYYGLLDHAGNFTSGWGAAKELLPELAQQFKKLGVTKINLIGNGVNLFAELVTHVFADFELVNYPLSSPNSATHAPAQIPQYCSLAQIACLGYENWCTEGVFSPQLQQLYLKTVQTVVNKNYMPR